MRMGVLALASLAGCSAPSRLVGALEGDGDGSGSGGSAGTAGEAGDTGMSATSGGTKTTGGSESGDEVGGGLDFWDYAACPDAVVANVELEIDGIEVVYELHTTMPCTVTTVGSEADRDTVALQCDDEGTPLAVTIALGNDVVRLADLLAVEDVLVFDFAAAAYEYSGRWFTLRRDGELRVGVAAGGTAVPYLSDEGSLDGFFSPLRLGSEGGHCPPGPGSCFALGEPAAVEITHDGVPEPVQVLPFQSDTIEGYSIHAGDSWLSIDSEYSCDGSNDDRVRVAFGAI